MFNQTGQPAINEHIFLQIAGMLYRSDMYILYGLVWLLLWKPLISFVLEVWPDTMSVVWDGLYIIELDGNAEENRTN